MVYFGNEKSLGKNMGKEGRELGGKTQRNIVTDIQRMVEYE